MDQARDAFMKVAEPSISDTIVLMSELHFGQVDKLGLEYRQHPLRVVENLKRVFPDVEDDVIKAALLHDVMEDCGVTPDFLRNRGYSESCITMISLVTKPEDDDRPYKQVISDLIASGNKGAMMIKIADNMDNLHPERQDKLRLSDPQRADRFKEKYVSSIEILSEALSLDSKRILDLVKNSHSLETIGATPEPCVGLVEAKIN